MTLDKDSPLVTVGIPTYNRPKGLAHTLDCITGQTYANLEIIISDNCSTDSSVLPLIREYAAKDHRIKYHVQETNLSIVPNFQFLLDQARGEYFMWAADDDSWDKNFIEVCLNGLQNDKGVVAAVGDVKIVGLNNAVLDTKLDRSFLQANMYRRLYNWIKAPREATYFFCSLYRSNIAKGIKFQNNWGGDHMFLLELISKGKFLYIPGKTNFYYYRGGSSTSAKRVREAFNIKNRFFFFDWYIIRYTYYPFHFGHLNFFQKFGLFFSISTGLLLNEEGILFTILIVKPFKALFKKIGRLLHLVPKTPVSIL